ncbi:MAG: hypothetical protein ACPL7J_13965, partial [Desulfomonilaceae bacterium]
SHLRGNDMHWDNSAFRDYLREWLYVMPESIRRPGNSSWIPFYVGMTCSGSTAQFAIIFKNGKKSEAPAAACVIVAAGACSFCMVLSTTFPIWSLTMAFHNRCVGYGGYDALSARR